MSTTKIKKTKKQRQGYIYILLGIIALSLLFYLFLRKPVDKKMSVGEPPKSSPSILEIIAGKDTGKGMPARVLEEIKPSIIKSVRFTPEDPNILDSIKAEVSTDYDHGNIIYEYLWEINNKLVTDIKGDTLPAGIFKKGDAIRVFVTPFVDGIKGHTYESRFVVIHSAPPSLDLIETKQKLNNTIELQLVSKDPDNDKVTFSLEEPVIKGMSIDKETGKIIYKPEKKEKGTYKFRASATDIDGAKITKTFEFKID
ncbi:hypothetical protein A45J_2666 [hot springs metagenome]|uniref:Cadherin domain-containing protein n=1 Tax=hot springs metagenome TaxID=433727 RepID=A0A5J4L0K6_9ZZZZ